MRTLSPELAAHLAGETTSLCHCWRVTRHDGTVLGFTDHDGDLTFENTVFHAASGLDAAEAVSHASFATGGGEVAGALDSEGLSEADLAAGLWDGARVETFLLNWRAPEQRVRLRIGEIGEVRRTGGAFVAELRAMMHWLDVPQGRLYASSCDAQLGDARCGRDVTGPAFRGTGAVLEPVSRFELVAEGIGVYAEGWFRAGILTWVSGPNAGRVSQIRDHRLDGAHVRLAFWQELAASAGPGDAFTVTAGCDKSFEMCRSRFSNAVNFRGFPHMPGTDRALAYAGNGGEMDGGSLFR